MGTLEDLKSSSEKLPNVLDSAPRAAELSSEVVLGAEGTRKLNQSVAPSIQKMTLEGRLHQ